MFVRVQWQPFEDKIGNLRSSLAHHINVILHSSQLQQLKLLINLSQAVELSFNAQGKERERIQTKEQVEERRQFLHWISPIDYEENLNDIIKQRHPQIGQWVVEHNDFELWIEDTNSSLLWCFGKREFPCKVIWLLKT